jgi:hypothetical protein
MAIEDESNEEQFQWMALAHPLTSDMIQATDQICQQFQSWQDSDQALLLLRQSLPGFSFEEVLLKVATINALYGTNVYAIFKVAENIHRLLKDTDPENVDIGHVEQVAMIPDIDKRFTSFASKFAHFFIGERFPIKDSYAERTIRYHLGRGKWEKHSGKPYEEFVVNFTKLKDSCAFNGSIREFDYYLWLAGLFREWEKKKDKAQINQEARGFFEDVNNEEILQRAFEGGL